LVPVDLKEPFAYLVGEFRQAERYARPWDHPQILNGKRMEPDLEKEQIFFQDMIL